MDGFGELMQLLENDIPECRRRLKESHANLEKVASYCEGNYLQVRQLYWHNLWVDVTDTTVVYTSQIHYRHERRVARDIDSAFLKTEIINEK